MAEPKKVKKVVKTPSGPGVISEGQSPNALHNFLRKWGLVIVLFLSLMTMMSTCSAKNSMKREATKSMQYDSATYADIQELNREVELLQVQSEISSLELAKRIVYDQNAIVRSKTRPDDVIRGYDEELAKLYKKRETLLNK